MAIWASVKSLLHQLIARILDLMKTLFTLSHSIFFPFSLTSFLSLILIVCIISLKLATLIFCF